MTEQGKSWPTGSITFRGRDIRVAMPSPEQLMVWQRIMRKLEQINESDWNASEVLDAVERTRKIIDSVMIDEKDVDWLDDEMLAGRIGLQEASEIVLDINRAFAPREKGQEVAKKTAAPARRKKAS